MITRIHAYLEDDGESRAIVRAKLGVGREVVFVDDAALERELGAIEVLVCGHAPRPADWSRAVALRLVHLLGSGTDSLWPARGLPERVVVANARGMHATAMRDHALGLMLAFERDLPRTLADQAARRWEPVARGSLAGCGLCVVGLGEVGRTVAAAGHALGMRVVGVRARPDEPAPAGVERVYGPRELTDALAGARYVVLVVPLTDATRGMFGEPVFSAMDRDAVLVQMSRGGVVDEAALVRALRNGAIRGAALDVFEHEPLPPDSALWDVPGLIVTPHIAGWMPGYLARALAIVADNLARLEQGLAVRTPVDRARGY